jgi:hypothetical protein
MFPENFTQFGGGQHALIFQSDFQKYTDFSDSHTKMLDIFLNFNFELT